MLIIVNNKRQKNNKCLNLDIDASKLNKRKYRASIYEPSLTSKSAVKF